jgi:hypothetical protein
VNLRVSIFPETIGPMHVSISRPGEQADDPNNFQFDEPILFEVNLQHQIYSFILLYNIH